MQAALNGLRAAGAEPPSQDLRRVAPTNLDGINLRGTFDFPVEKFAERILPSTVTGVERPAGAQSGVGG